MRAPAQQLVGSLDSHHLRELFETHTTELSVEERHRIDEELFGWGPLTPLLDQEDLFEIIVQGSDHIFYETSEGMKVHNDSFFSATSFHNFMDRFCKEAQVVINQGEPFANAKVRGLRAHLVGPPIVSQFNLTLRKHQKRVLSLEHLEQQSFLTPTQRTVIDQIINEQANFLIIGPTGSGKTTFMNSLIGALPASQRVVVVEDTDEILLKNPLHAKMLTRASTSNHLKGISLEDLVKQSLRMRPDRIIVGEVRGQEAKDLMQALATGHSGSMGTMHAENPKQALIRLEMLIQMGAPQWQLEAIRRLIQLSLQYIITLKSDRQGKGVQSISKISSLEHFGFTIEDCLPQQSF